MQYDELLALLNTPAGIAAAAGIAVLLLLLLWLIARRSASNTKQKGTAPRRGLGAFFRKSAAFDEETRTELRELLLQSDFGPTAADLIIDALSQQFGGQTVEPQMLKLGLRDVLQAQLEAATGTPDDIPHPAVVALVGVNGSGKTTTIAKLAKRYREQNHDVVLGAADTFRAAAAEQLQTWGERIGVRVVRQAEGADPAAVAFDTVQAAAAAEKTAIIDTAGRIHGDQGLMNELKKVIRVISKAKPDAPDAIWLTLDAAQGLTALEQARKFCEAIPVSGLILNKLDGEGRAGYALAITRELELPIIALGVGEGFSDLEPFSAERFANRIVFGNPEGPETVETA